MGFTRVPTIYTLENVDGSEGFTVRMKSLRIGEMRKLMATLDSTDDDQSLNDSVTHFVDIVLKGAVSWNLEEEDGTEVPFDREGVESLEIGTLISLVSQWVDSLMGTSDDLGKGSPSGKPFPGQPVTMEAL
jgi:hypothetical protein